MPLTASQISSSFLPEIILHILSFLIGFAVSSLLFAMMFKWLPDAEIGWRDVQRTGEPPGSFAMDIPHNTTWGNQELRTSTSISPHQGGDRRAQQGLRRVFAQAQRCDSPRGPIRVSEQKLTSDDARSIAKLIARLPDDKPELRSEQN